MAIRRPKSQPDVAGATIVQARQGLEVNEVEDGLIIYDPVSGQVHHLNPTAAVVFALCDGRGRDEIAAEVATVFGLSDSPSREVGICVADLLARGLVS